MWDLDNREESGLQRYGGSKESQSEQFGRSSIRILEGLKEDGGWHTNREDQNRWEVEVVCIGQTSRALYFRL